MLAIARMGQGSGLSSRLVAILRDWSRKWHPGLLLGDDEEATIRELERLAETSPHLLEDAGLLEMPCARSAGRRVFSGKGYRLDLTTPMPGHGDAPRPGECGCAGRT